MLTYSRNGTGEEQIFEVRRNEQNDAKSNGMLYWATTYSMLVVFLDPT